MAKFMKSSGLFTPIIGRAGSAEPHRDDSAHATAWELLQTFLAARFKGAERFRRRLEKVAELENTLTKQLS